jgi:hypothetical protein
MVIYRQLIDQVPQSPEAYVTEGQNAAAMLRNEVAEKSLTRAIQRELCLFGGLLRLQWAGGTLTTVISRPSHGMTEVVSEDL